MTGNPYVLDWSGPQNVLSQWSQQNMQRRQMDQQQGQFNATNALARDQFSENSRQFGITSGMDRDRLKIAQGQAETQKRAADFDYERGLSKHYGGLAQMWLNEPDQNRQGEMFKRVSDADPRFKSFLNEHLPGILHSDPVVVGRFLSAAAQGYQDPLEERKKLAEIKSSEGGEARAAALAPAELASKTTAAKVAGINAEDVVNPAGIYARRSAIAEQNGLRPGTQEHTYFMFDGTLPPRLAQQNNTLQNEIDKTRVDMAEKDIKTGYGAVDALKLTDQLTDLSKDPNLSAAIGPISGTSAYQTAIGGILPFGQSLGLANPDLNAKIRRFQTQLELAGGEKMRGLGAQSDSDAARLQRAVSNLTEARNPREFRDAIETIAFGLRQAAGRAQQAAKEYPQLGTRLNSGAAPPSSGSSPTANAVEDTKIVGGKTYVKINGNWFGQ